MTMWMHVEKFPSELSTCRVKMVCAQTICKVKRGITKEAISSVVRVAKSCRITKYSQQACHKTSQVGPSDSMQIKS